MFPAGSPHHNGGFYQQLGKSDEIIFITKTGAYVLQNHIASICEKNGLHYFASNGDNKQAKRDFEIAFSQYLHNDTTKIRKGERHETIKFICNSYFNKYENEWDNLTDDQRFDRVLEYDKIHCDTPLYETDPEEVKELWKWTQRTFRVERDSKKERRDNEKLKNEEIYKDVLEGLSEDKQNLFKSYDTLVQQALSGNIWLELEKDEWIIGNKRENVIYRSRAISHSVGDQKIISFDKGPRLLKCIPIEITVYENPLDFLEQQLTYTITFRDSTKKTYTLTRLTLDQIADWLKNHGYILPTGRRGGTVIELLSAMVDAFREDGKLEVDNRISSMGIYHVDGKLTFVGCEKYIERYQKQTLNQRQDAIRFIEELITKFRPGIISTALKVGVISPFNFALKQYTDDVVFVRSLWAFGATRTGKTTVTNIPNCMYFDKENDRKTPFTSVNSEARLGYFVSRDTFPASVYELKALNKDDPKATIMIEMLKAAIETKEARGTMNKQSTVKTKCPAFRQINFSSNPRPPNDPALSSRIIKQIFTDKDKHNKQLQNDFHKFMKDKYHLRTLGDFMIGYLYDNPTEIIFKEDKAEIDWEQCAKELITKFYEVSMMPRPSGWLDLPLTSMEDEDYETDETSNNIDSLRTALLSYFNDAYNKYIKNLGEKILDGQYERVRTTLSIEERIEFCIDKNVTPCFTRGAKGRLIIFHGILDELEKRGISSDRIGSLREVKELLGMEYGPLCVNYKTTKCVYGDIQKLYDFVTVTDGDIQKTLPISN
jgi:hypothetical protein